MYVTVVTCPEHGHNVIFLFKNDPTHHEVENTFHGYLSHTDYITEYCDISSIIENKGY